MPVDLQRTADDVLAKNYEPLKAEVLRGVAGKLRRLGIKTISPDHLEDAYNQGWEGVHEDIVRGKPLILPGLLFTITYRRAIDIWRREHEDRRVELDLESQSVEADVAAQLDDKRKLDRLFSRLKERLSEKEQTAIKLCLLRGYRRAEAADSLGVDRVAFERIMDSATKKIAAVVASIEARGCGDEEWSRLMRDYALGLLAEDDRDYERAHTHVQDDEGCESCRRYVRALQGLAALPPLVSPRMVSPHTLTHFLRTLMRLLGGSTRAASETATAGTRGDGLALNGTGRIVAVLGAAATLSFLGLHAATPAHQPERSHSYASGVEVPSVLSSRPLIRGPGGLNASYDWKPQHAKGTRVLRRAHPKSHPVERANQTDPPEFSFERATSTANVTHARSPAPEPEPVTPVATRPREREPTSTAFGFEE